MELFVDNWYFLKTPLDTTWEEMEARRQEFQPVELPHDWLIYNAKNLYEDSFGWYRKTFPWKCKTGERVILRFDGVYMNSTVYCNGMSIFDWKYGYSTFDVDLTEQLKDGDNELVVLVRHQSPNSRWYSGAGIYRNVWLKQCKETYLPLDGTYVHIVPADSGLDTTKKLPADTDFVMHLETEVGGNVTEDTKVVYTLIGPDGSSRALGEKTCNALCNGKVCLDAEVAAPLLWSTDAPNCYTLQVELQRGSQTWDSQRITVGFKTMAFDADKGFFLNGEWLKLHGVCEHHDLGCLGAAFNEAALRRQFTILKEMGVNSLRTSHNMPAPEFMELADRMGFLVDSEAFDMWERPKTTYDYARFFVEWAERDVRSWVRRDRNHPSLLLWSIGNEIYDTHADAHGEEITRRLAGYVKEHDPRENARVTIGSNYMPWTGAQNCADIVKMAGYNYGERYYEKHHKEHPDWIIYGSETASVVQSRGIYHFPLSQSILADEDEQCSALGNSSTSWGAESTVKCITDDRDAKFSLGMFIWTGFDYIGEPTPYHTKNSYFGQIDTAGFPKDPYYIYQAEWTDYKKAPMVHLYPYWDFNPGQLIDVCACSNCPKVELFLNDKSLGCVDLDHENGLELLASFRVAYEPGVIRAVAYDEKGCAVAHDERHSFGQGEQISLAADKTTILGDGKDLSFITIETVDRDGYPVENAVDYVHVTVEGAGRLLGLDNGDSTDYDDYKSATRKLFSGKLLAVVAGNGEAGEIRVKVSGEGLKSAEVILQAEDPGENRKKGFLEDCQSVSQKVPGIIPVRKVELLAQEEHLLTKEHPEQLLEAVVYPENASDVQLQFRAVNPAGIEVNTAKLQVVSKEENRYRVRVTAVGDGEFRVRCMAQDSKGKVTVISQLEYEAQGLGEACLNPYELVIAGLFTESLGEIGNGNEKGISTAREGLSGVFFDNVDFGEYGSDELILPVFALDDKEYPIDVWVSEPGQEKREILTTLVYQKPSIWNTYQEETYTLPRRIKGVVSIGFTMRAKVHFKGFRFVKKEKAFGQLFAGDASRIYGDSFEQKGNYVEGIGNNVTLEYDNMDFGCEGTSSVCVCGRTGLPVNTIHVRFTPEDGGTILNRIIEFRGDACGEYTEQSFSFEPFGGKGRMDLVFLPGSQFDLAYFRFQ